MRVVTETDQRRDDDGPTGRYVLDLQEIDRTQVAVAGGKGANLGELTRIGGLEVPAGFCVTTDSFRRMMAETPSIGGLLERLSRLGVDDHDDIRALSAEIRRTIEESGMSSDVSTAIERALAEAGEDASYAVRSSATAEDLPTASFAGQQDTYLDITGREAILRHVRRCWASLFTERATTYRIHNGVDHRKVQMAVVVQRMIFPRAAGILFTADPVTGNRKIVSVEATLGLGEALVSGLVNADVYKVRDDEIVVKTVAGDRRVLDDDEVTSLARLGRRIEAHFGSPQDVEWCLDDAGRFHIVQSRPITTLFPVPVVGDDARHVFLSVGHQQMMTDAMKPLGISMWQLTAAAPMYEAGGRLFVDVAATLATAAGRAGLLGMIGKSDPLTGDALRTIIERDFIPLRPDAAPVQPARRSAVAPAEADPSLVAELIAQSRASNEKLKRDIETQSGPALFEFILADRLELKRVLFDPRSYQAIMAGMEAAWWLNDRLEEWLGEKNAADALTQSVSGNITSQMGLDLLRVADAIRPHPAVVAFLEQTDDESFLNDLPALPGGREARDAIQGWLDRYGMRCVGEIDVSRPRWAERPTALLPLLLGNVANFEPGAAERRFAEGLETARRKEAELIERLLTVPDGESKAREVKRMIDRLRAFIGYREYPKYFMVDRYFAYRRALLREARSLVDAQVIRDGEDIFFLTFQELHDVVRTHEVDYRLIRERKEAFKVYQGLTPPRVSTSDGEIVAGAYRREALPAGALVGLAVSAGTVEGRARVVFDPATAVLEPDDILVTPFTDPSWTALFVAIKGLVTEVGGLMTHGAVIAREYGLPAVVGVENATRLIRDGQRIRVHGTDGYVELLD